MLQELGFNQYAYGNRPKHQATMKHELKLAKEKGIKVKAVWLYINLNKDTIGQLKPHSEAIFNTLKETGLQTQIWIGFQPTYFDDLTDGESLKQSIAMVKHLSKRANAIGCKIALYNHGGWFGNSKNQLKIIKSLPKQDIGIVFNFHHAHQNLDTFQQDIKKMLPYLWSVSLNGMKKEGPKIITIGEGSLEKEMIQELLDLGYKGPFGILGHVKGGDAAIILEKNLNGLHMLFPQ
jgi:sugar phosphate isomerase/epimerase